MLEPVEERHAALAASVASAVVAVDSAVITADEREIIPEAAETAERGPSQNRAVNEQCYAYSPSELRALKLRNHM